MAVTHKTCCFTGHRVIPSEALPWLAASLEKTVRGLVAEGFCYFGTGGALGFDTLAAETILRLRGEYPHIKLILVLPCRDQAENWRAEDAARYEAIRAQADKVVYTSETYTQGCMHKRNRCLVDHSSACVAYCTRATGGSAYTVAYARRKGIRLINLQTAGSI